MSHADGGTWLVGKLLGGKLYVGGKRLKGDTFGHTYSRLVDGRAPGHPEAAFE